MTRVVMPESWRAQPWQNGRGTTHEIWRDPDDGAYAIRVSCAEVTEPGPFSLFPGYRRWSFLVGPAPIKLGDHELVKPGDHVELPGDVAIEARFSEPTRLLNILTRDDHRIACGFGLALEPVRFVFALAASPELPRWHSLVLEPPARFERRSIIWVR